MIAPAALAHVPGWGAGAPAIAALSGGALNRSFRVDTVEGSYVVRVNDPIAAALGADHVREARLHTAAALAGLAPQVIYADPAAAFIITRFQPGMRWHAADFAQPQSLRRLGALLRSLHAIAPPVVAPFDLAALLRDHSEYVIAAQPAARMLLESLMEQAIAASLCLARDGRAASIVHNDLHPSNLIQGERLHLIDWEYAAVADPLFDPACVLAYYPHAEPYAQELLIAAGLAQVSQAALEQARFLFLLLSFLWYRRCRLSCGWTADPAVEGELLQRLVG